MLYYNLISFKDSNIQFKKDEKGIISEFYITFR